MSEHAYEVARGERFEFGANWARFLEVLDEDRIRRAVESLQTMLGMDDLTGLRFLDAGSGSGGRRPPVLSGAGSCDHWKTAR